MQPLQQPEIGPYELNQQALHHALNKQHNVIRMHGCVEVLFSAVMFCLGTWLVYLLL